MPYARRDGLELYYERAGSGEPEMLFVPGWCCDTTFFAPQFEHFAATHAVTAFDPRGCGRSSVPADGYDIPSLADDELRAKIVDMMCSVPLGIAALPIRDLREWNGVAALALCEVPLLLLLSYVRSDLERLRKFKPDLHVAVTVGAGHFHQLEVPDQVNAMIERFLEVGLPAA